MDHDALVTAVVIIVSLVVFLMNYLHSRFVTMVKSEELRNDMLALMIAALICNLATLVQAHRVYENDKDEKTQPPDLRESVVICATVSAVCVIGIAVLYHMQTPSAPEHSTDVWRDLSSKTEGEWF